MAATPEQLIADARAYAATVVDDARDALDDAMNMVRDIGYAYPNYNDVTLPDEPVQSLDLTPPTLVDVTLDLPAEPENTLVFQDISEIEPGTAPEFTETAPTITLPTQPNQLAAFQGVAPTINTDIEFPDPPDELLNPLIPAPVLADRDEPTAPQVLLPVFEGVMPEDTTEAPTNLDATFADAYRDMAPSTVAMLDGYVDAMLAKFNPQFHTQMAALEAKLTTYLEGGTALSPEVETAIYERARDKTMAEARRVQDAARQDAADRGFTLPPGALSAALQGARQAAADNNARAAQDIAIKQAELEQQNVQFAITTSAGLRSTLLNATLSYHQNLITINGQAIDYAKSVVGMLVEVYNTAVKMFGVKLDAYRAQAQVYEVRLKGAMASIDLYRAEIDALQAMTSVDRAKVEVYQARIGALTALANVYRGQIEAVQGRVSLEKLNLDVFQARVQAYSAEVQAKNSEWDGYKASLEGQTARVRVFSTQADAYNSRVQGYRARIDALAQVVSSQAATNRARADQYQATVQGFSTIVNARGDVARTQIQNQSQKLVAFQAQVEAATANARVGAEYYRAVSAVGLENAKNRMTAQIQTAESIRNFGQSIAQLGQAQAQVHTGFASSVMAGMNSLVSSNANTNI